MEWVERLRGSVVAIDTAPFIYFVERHARYHGLLRPFFESLDQANFVAVTSILTVIEVLVQPLRAGNTALAQQYRDILLNARNLTTLVVTRDIAEEAAKLRALHRLQTPDAIHLATAMRGGAATFITNDVSMKPTPGLAVVTLDQMLTLP
ncbi:MAG: type II toxin-antitoxin system VapC family toxin [Pirellulales bacterium]